MNLRKKLEKPGHLEKAIEAERPQKQVALRIRQVQAGDTGGTVGGHTEIRLLGGSVKVCYTSVQQMIPACIRKNCYAIMV